MTAYRVRRVHAAAAGAAEQRRARVQVRQPPIPHPPAHVCMGFNPPTRHPAPQLTPLLPPPSNPPRHPQAPVPWT